MYLIINITCGFIRKDISMKKKTKILIGLAFLISIISIVLTVTVYIYNHTEVKNTEEYHLENIYKDYMELDEEVVATVNGEPITNKDLLIVKYLNRPRNVIKEAISQKSIIILAQSEGFSLSKSEIDNEVKYITEDYYRLNLPETEENIKFKNHLIRNYLEICTAIRYKGHIERQIMDNEFQTDNKTINKKCEKFTRLFTKWENSDKPNSRLFRRIWLLADEIVEDYIDYRIKEFPIEKY